MHRLIVTFIAAAGFVTPAVSGSHVDPQTSAKELMQTCVAADNDARNGILFEIECEQFVSGFVEALLLTGMAGEGTEICPPDTNMPDEVRWAFTRWIHGSFTERTQLSAAEALLGTLKDEFPCGG